MTLILTEVKVSKQFTVSEYYDGSMFNFLEFLILKKHEHIGYHKGDKLIFASKWCFKTQIKGIYFYLWVGPNL